MNNKSMERTWKALHDFDKDIAYFETMTKLTISNIALKNVPLPPNLTTLRWCINSELPKLPNKIKVLCCDSIGLKKLPDELPPNLTQLICFGNNLEYLPKLPDGLLMLNCNHNKLQELPKLPDSIRILNCGKNEIRDLNNLPDKLKILHCENNLLNTLPDLPPNLDVLICDNNNLSKLPPVPPSLGFLICNNNRLTDLNISPKNSLFKLTCNDNQLTSLPITPYLRELSCKNNPINIWKMVYEHNITIDPDMYEFCAGKLTTCLEKHEQELITILNRDLVALQEYYTKYNNFVKLIFSVLNKIDEIKI